MRWIKFSLGLLFTAIGIIGAFVPVLPSTIFFIIATFYFSQSSEKAENWLLNHPRFGPPVVRWRTSRAIPKSAKILASTSISISGLIIFLAELPLLVTGIAYTILASSLAYILSRPS